MFLVILILVTDCSLGGERERGGRERERGEGERGQGGERGRERERESRERERGGGEREREGRDRERGGEGIRCAIPALSGSPTGSSAKSTIYCRLLLPLRPKPLLHRVVHHKAHKLVHVLGRTNLSIRSLLRYSFMVAREG